MCPRMALRSRCIRGSSSSVSSRFANSATLRTSSIVTPACSFIVRQSFSIKVYLAHPHVGDTRHFSSKLYAHAYQLAEPRSILHLHLYYAIHIAHHDSALGHRLATNDRPCRREPILIAQRVQTPPQRGFQKIPHSFQ